MDTRIREHDELHSIMDTRVREYDDSEDMQYNTISPRHTRSEERTIWYPCSLINRKNGYPHSRVWRWWRYVIHHTSPRVIPEVRNELSGIHVQLINQKIDTRVREYDELHSYMDTRIREHDDSEDM